jgi:hypothetical protein
MTNFLLSMLSDLICGSSKRWIAAAEALEAPPANAAAQRYRPRPLRRRVSIQDYMRFCGFHLVTEANHRLLWTDIRRRREQLVSAMQEGDELWNGSTAAIVRSAGVG